MPKSVARSRRTLLVVLVALVVLVPGCAITDDLAPAGGPVAPVPRGTDSGRPQVLTTFTVTADMARRVGGGRVDVDSITRIGSEIHEYEPTPDDLVRGAGADLLLDNGLGLERWFDQFVDRARIPAVTLSDGVAPIPIDVGPFGGRPNPHAWMSPLNGMVYVENIRRALTAVDPAGAPVYRQNADRYADELRRVNDELVAALARIPPAQRVLVSCEGAFSYLARDAGLREAYLWPVNTDAEGTPRQIAATILTVRATGVPAVFCESTVNDAPQRQVVDETGARLGPPLYVDSLSVPDGPVPSYLELLRHDARVIASALTAPGAV